MNPVDRLVYTTTQIETESVNGAGSGTGFFVTLCKDDTGGVPVIVTNKHVIEGAEVGHFRFTLGKDGSPKLGHVVKISVRGFESKWLKHPDPHVDLAVFTFAPIAQQLEAMGSPVFYVSYEMSAIADQAYLTALRTIEDVIMIGYPSGLWDSHHNLPIVRRGVTATPAGVLFNGRAEFVIDCACFPGSSGSPILLFNPSGHLDEEGNWRSDVPRLRLLGILWGGPQFDAVGEVHVVPVPTSVKELAVSQIPMNLGYCVRATELRWFEDHFQALRAAEETDGTQRGSNVTDE